MLLISPTTTPMHWRSRLAEFERLNPQDESSFVCGTMRPPPPKPTPPQPVNLLPILLIILALPALPLGIFYPWLTFFWIALLTPLFLKVTEFIE